MKNRRTGIVILVMLMTFVGHCTYTGNPNSVARDNPLGNLGTTDLELWQHLITTNNEKSTAGNLVITRPYDGAVFPPEIAAPIFRWTDPVSTSTHWLLVIELDSAQPVHAIVDSPYWIPDKATWDTIKTGSDELGAEVGVFGIRLTPHKTITSHGRIRISTSKDRVDATVLYRQVPLPFNSAPHALRQIKWRLGDIASYKEPPVVMQNQSTCTSCHQVSKDGGLISMELNYNGDSGAQFIAPVSRTIALSKNSFMTWSDFPKPDMLPPTRGVFAKLSPSGNFMVGTVNEIAFFALTNDPAYCQLFFPTYGVLAWYDVHERRFHRLPGADKQDAIQTDPSWSWDEKYVVFARAKTKNEYHDDITNIRTRIEDTDIHTMNRKYPIRFDLYRIAFNKGQGGVPEPLRGASGNGMSNYFARYSPNGRWIVFTRSKSGIMLQPDSQLYIIPAAGGLARRMQCNREIFNSWHSFSPNGKWMLFSSKANSVFTEIFLTHIDANGIDSPPVCLSRFSDSCYAANVPEFVNLAPGAIQKITVAGN